VKSVMVLIVIIVSSIFAKIEVFEDGEGFSSISEIGGVKLIVFEKGLLGFASVITVKMVGNKNVVLFQNQDDNDDYITANVNFFDKVEDWYIYDVNKDQQLASLFKRSKKVIVVFVNYEHGDDEGLFSQVIDCTGFVKMYSKAKEGD